MGIFSGGAGLVRVYDVYEERELGVTNASSFTVAGIAGEGTALLRLSAVSGA